MGMAHALTPAFDTPMKDDIAVLLKTFDLYPDALIIVDQEGIIIEHNEQTLPTFGYEKNELVGASINQIIPEKYHQRHARHIKQFSGHSYKRKMGAGLKLMARHKNGNEFDVDIALSPLKRGRENFALAVIRNISDRVRAERKIHHLERSKEELEKFSYTVSHDLKAPLQRVKGLVELILQELPPQKNSQLQEMAGHLNYSLETMEKLICNILDYARDKELDKKETVDLNLILQEVIQNIVVPANFKIKVPVALPAVTGHHTGLFQVFLNLVTNSIKYNNKLAGEVVIEWQEKKRCYEFSISDNGVRVPEGQRKEIFKLFHRGKVREDKTSHGIGLYIVKETISRSGGAIWYEESKLGGSSLIFRWPR